MCKNPVIKRYFDRFLHNVSRETARRKTDHISLIGKRQLSTLKSENYSPN